VISDKKNSEAFLKQYWAINSDPQARNQAALVTYSDLGFIYKVSPKAFSGS
jgi:hypothetical protein